MLLNSGGKGRSNRPVSDYTHTKIADPLEGEDSLIKRKI